MKEARYEVYAVIQNDTPDKAKRDEAIQRFLKTGGQPPKGAKLLGRWTAADLAMDMIYWRATM
ncbi:MAG: DUF3303 family protein [Nitrospirales bacterium]